MGQFVFAHFQWKSYLSCVFLSVCLIASLPTTRNKIHVNIIKALVYDMLWAKLCNLKKMFLLFHVLYNFFFNNETSVIKQILIILIIILQNLFYVRCAAFNTMSREIALAQKKCNKLPCTVRTRRQRCVIKGLVNIPCVTQKI